MASGRFGNLSLVLDPRTSAPLMRPPPKRLARLPAAAKASGSALPRMLLREVTMDKPLPSEEVVGRVTRQGNLVWTAPTLRAHLRRTRQGLTERNALALQGEHV